MRTVLVPIAALALVAAPAVAQTPAWSTYADPALGFSVLFPGQPAASEKDLPVGDQTVKMTSVTAADDQGVYMVAVVDYGVAPESSKAALDGAVSGMVSSVDGQLVSQQAITVGGQPAREVVIRSTSTGSELLLKVRAVSSGTKLYEALAGGAGPTGAPDADRFLASFTLL